jgi:hypothetical protein
MRAQDTIAEIGIDGNGGLYVKPSNKTFPYMYREALEVSWAVKHSRLYSPPPRKWSHLNWFQHICQAAKVQGCDLSITQDTDWSNISSDLREEIERQD